MPCDHPLLPQVLWAQRKENVFLTVEVQDAQDLKIDLEEQSLKFHAKSGENVYEFSLNFPEKINKEKSKWSANRLVHILIDKAEAKRWPKLDVDKSKAHWLKCDWDKWLDTDEEESASKGRGGGGGAGGPGAGGMDWSSMMGGGDMDFSSMMGANGGGMGMDGLGPMGDDDDVSSGDEDDDADDLENVDEPVNLDGDLDGVPTDAKVTDIKGDEDEGVGDKAD